jgi:C1A family cysteine protease
MVAKHEYIRAREDHPKHPVRAKVGQHVPTFVDLRAHCSPIEDQGDLGACTGHAIVGALEYLENIQREAPIRLSRLFVYYNERQLEGTVRQDAGAAIGDGIKVIMTYGACEESIWPYQPKTFTRKPDDAAYEDGLKRKALKAEAVEESEQAITEALADGLPVVFGIVVYSSFESDEVAQSGIVPMPQPGEENLGGHAVLMVGYDLEKRMVLVRNSWGPDWGIQGYFWLPLDFVLDPKLADSFYTVDRIE